MAKCYSCHGTKNAPKRIQCSRCAAYGHLTKNGGANGCSKCYGIGSHICTDDSHVEKKKKNSGVIRARTGESPKAKKTSSGWLVDIEGGSWGLSDAKQFTGSYPSKLEANAAAKQLKQLGYTPRIDPLRYKNSGESISDAESLSEGFHGREPLEAFDIEETLEYQENLACLGELEELEILNETHWNETGELKTFTFSRKKKDLVRLAGSPDRTQLFLVGGDQEITSDVLAEFAGKAAKKDKISLGFVYSISYWSDKHHLEGSNGKMEAYMHCFGENTFENPDAKKDGQADYLIYKPEQKLGAGLLPELIYDRVNQNLELVGGGYEIRDEGIWD